MAWVHSVEFSLSLSELAGSGVTQQLRVLQDLNQLKFLCRVVFTTLSDSTMRIVDPALREQLVVYSVALSVRFHSKVYIPLLLTSRSKTLLRPKRDSIE